MPDLPERADLDQLRRQARELLRAAVAGEPRAVAALTAVSDRPTLAAAQLTIARGHGFRSWAALRAEVASRRPPVAWLPAADPGQRETLAAAPARRAYAGWGTVTAAEGVLTPRALLAGPDEAFLGATLAVAPGAVARKALGARSWIPDLDDVRITDDGGSVFTLRFSGGGTVPEPDGGLRCEVTCAVSPVPDGTSRWLDIHGQDASVLRLQAADPVPVQVSGPAPITAGAAERELRDLAASVLHGYLGYLDLDSRDTPEFRRRCRDVLARTAELRGSGLADGLSPLADQLGRLCGALSRRRPPTGLPRGWQSVLDAAGRTDGPSSHFDVSAALPAVDGTSVRLDALVSWPDSWDLYLQAVPGWWTYSADRTRKRGIADAAEDDLGGLYVSNFGGSSGHRGHEQLKLTFRPRLDPRASLLRLTFASQTEQVTAEVPLSG